jgi:hypothetical protein
MSAELPSPNQSGPSGISQADLNQLAQRVTALETRFPTSSWLFGTSFLKRAFAIYGYYLVAGFIIGAVVMLIFFACFLLSVGLGLATFPRGR